MPKTKRLITMYGGTLDPIYRFMTQAVINVSPYDSKGNRLAREFYTNMAGGDSRLKLPEFKLEVKMNPEVKKSFLEATYSKLTREQLEEHLRVRRFQLSHAHDADQGVQQRGQESAY